MRGPCGACSFFLCCPGNKLLGYFHSVPPGQEPTQLFRSPAKLALMGFSPGLLSLALSGHRRSRDQRFLSKITLSPGSSIVKRNFETRPLHSNPPSPETTASS